MTKQSLPLWWSIGRLDNGAFVEGLTLEGVPISLTESRVRVQARQVYSYALAMNNNLAFGNLHPAFEQSIHRFINSCFRADGVAGRRINIANGNLIDTTADLYDTAFCLLALAESTVVVGKAITGPVIQRLLAGLDSTMAYENNQGFREFLPAPETRTQNPHMHLFEALLRLYDVTLDESIAERISMLDMFIRATFFDRENRWISEEVSSSIRSIDYEPGHSMEWVWLLGYQARLFGQPLDPFALDLYENYQRLDIAEGYMPLKVGATGVIVDGNRRLWSQTEALKGHLCLLELDADGPKQIYEKNAAECANSILDDWLMPSYVEGGWHNNFDGNDQLISTFMPTTSGYHVYLATSELARITNP